MTDWFDVLYVSVVFLTLSMLDAFGFRRRRRCRLISLEELCSVELLNLEANRIQFLLDYSNT